MALSSYMCKMKKAGITLSTILMVTMFLTGCSSLDHLLSEQMMKRSGVLSETSYQEYERLKAGGELDSVEFYQVLSGESTERVGTIRVTFATNNNLQIQYYTDASHKQAINNASCFLEPGDTLYATVNVDEDTFSSQYAFSGFQVYEYAEDGSRKLSSSLQMHAVDQDYVLMIPKDFAGFEVAIEPIGEYRKRIISLNDYVSDDDGKVNPLDGTWLIDEKECTSETIEISPVSSYIMSYTYDSDAYFYLSSSPKCFYNNQEDGIVIFEKREPADMTVDYVVELHKYISVALVSDMDREIWINGGEKEEIKANHEKLLTGLKYGDKVTIETNKEWANLETDRDLICISSEQVDPTSAESIAARKLQEEMVSKVDASKKHIYTLIVPDMREKFIFNPSDYSYEHGTISFFCYGQSVTSTQELAKGSRIKYEQSSAEDGYWLPRNDQYIIVGNEADTIKRLKDIRFVKKVPVKVFLPQPGFGGSVDYTVNGTRVDVNPYLTYSGEKIKLKFNPWEGWISPFAGEVEYEVGSIPTQTVKANGMDINDALKEDEGHKPTLNVVLDKSVGEKMGFELKASGCELGVTYYGDDLKLPGKISGSHEIISGAKIGTEKPIVVTMSDRAIPTGKAVRMTIVMTDSEKNKMTDIRFIDDLSEKLEPISIYPANTIATSTVWYRSIEIMISVVSVERFSPTTASANTLIIVKEVDPQRELRNGDFIEGSQKVVVTIEPATGYYVTGKNVKNDRYQETMTFANYQKDIRDIVEKHPARRVFTITLDQSDAHATYIYRLDGNEVSGTIEAREGQMLELTYQVDDPDYKLKNASSGFIFGIGSSDVKTTVKVPITSAMNGKTVTKADFKIETVKVGD